MRPVVVDASAWIELICGRVGWQSVAELLEPANDLHVPSLCDVEVVTGLRKLSQRGQIDDADVDRALATYRIVAVQRHHHDLLLPRMYELRDVATAYDAAYLALAEALDAPLATLDRRLARTAQRQLGIAPELENLH